MEAESQKEAVQEGLNAGCANRVGEKGKQAEDGESAKAQGQREPFGFKDGGTMGCGCGGGE